MTRHEGSSGVKKPLYEAIASTVQAYHNCVKSGNAEWETKHKERLEHIQKHILPQGSGFDAGCEIDLEKSTGEKLHIITHFHHMNEGGYYDGWTDHKVVVTPSLLFGIRIQISGKDRNQIKEYMHEMFTHLLTSQYDDETEKLIPNP